MSKRLSLVLMLCAGCGDVVSGDATVDVGVDGARDDAAADTLEVADSRDVVLVDRLDAVDIPSSLDSPDAFDAQPLTDIADADADADATDSNINGPPCIGPEPRPMGVGRSCLARDGGIDPRLCDEVHYCGGAFIGGTPNAWVGAGTRPIANEYHYESCDYYPAVALSGYVDSYEVTVSRYRSWVNAGMPGPIVGDFVANGLRWTNDDAINLRNASPVEYVPLNIGLNDSRPRVEACTWTPEEGPNELRPINCVNVWAALAFCAWDGKQLLSEIAWEYLARNRGTTEVPFGNSRNDVSVCNLADVGGWVTAAGGRTLCPSTPLPLSVFDRPDDVTTNPPGIHGLFGGVAEYVRRSVYNPPGIALRNRQMCFGRRTDLIVDGQVETWSGGNVVFIVPVVQINTRGASWFDRNEFEPHRFSASLLHNSATTAAEGFRCGRSERPVR